MAISVDWKIKKCNKQLDIFCFATTLYKFNTHTDIHIPFIRNSATYIYFNMQDLKNKQNIYDISK